jgi:hypothetical protein
MRRFTSDEVHYRAGAPSKAGGLSMSNIDTAQRFPCLYPFNRRIPENASYHLNRYYR